MMNMVLSFIVSVQRAFDVKLSVALVHFFPPKHHARVLRIIGRVLAEDPDNISCLLSKGYVLQAAGKWEEAQTNFSRVVHLQPGDELISLEAREELSWCAVARNRLEDGAKGLTEVIEALGQHERNESSKARATWRLGRCLWASGGLCIVHC